MKKTFVFHTNLREEYFANGWNPALMAHYICIQRYMNIFDKIIMVLSFDNLNDLELRSAGLNWANQCTLGHGNVEIKIRKNSYLAEVDTFKSEILDKLDYTNELVFFAHAKGITRMDGFDQYTLSNKESLIRWICGMYFFNLEVIDDVEARLYGKVRPSEVFYGTFLTRVKNPEASPQLRHNKNNLFYQGTFYWINMPRLSRYIEDGLVKIPKIDDRYWAEMLPGTICNNRVDGDGVTSYKDVVIGNYYDLYNMGIDGWTQLSIELGGEQYGFINFTEYVLNKSLYIEDANKQE